MTVDDLARQLRERGARVTPARLRVLALLRGASKALSQREVEDALAGEAPVDRVTLYRVLDWLVEQGFAHKFADEMRIFRFSAASHAGEQHGAHAHFVCDDCGKVFCLDEVQPAPPPLPEGFATTQVEYSVHGHCAACNLPEPHK